MHGYPDFFGQSVYPKYGDAKVVLYNQIIPVLTNVTVLLISVQGVISAIEMSLYGDGWNTNSEWHIEIDGTAYEVISMGYVFSLSYVSYKSADWEMCRYSHDTKTGIVSLRREIPYRTSFKLLFTNSSAVNTPRLQCHCRYYEVI